MSAKWNYCRLEYESSATAIFNICNASISQGGKNRAVFNITILIRHLKTKHSMKVNAVQSALQAGRNQIDTV